MSLKIVGVSGKAGHGKDAIAEILCEQQGFVRIALADALKAGAAAIFGLSHDQLYGSKKEVADPFWEMSPRKILQLLGTEAIRATFGADTWILALRRQIDTVESNARLLARGPAGIVIPDVRFDNEARAVLQWGGQVWRVSRPGVVAVNPHASETALDEFDDFTAHVPNTGTLADLARHVEELIDEGDRNDRLTQK